MQLQHLREKMFIQQPAGLGDIFFLQKLCKIFHKERYETYHKIEKNMWFAGANRLTTSAHCHWNLPNPSKHDLIYNGSRYPNNPEDTMRTKYTDVGMEYDDWKEYFTYERDSATEEKLRISLGVEEGDKFLLWNNVYAFNLINDNVEQHIDSDLKRIKIDQNITNIFDWCWMLENACEIHTTDTCLSYIIETLDIKSTILKIHPRNHYATKAHDGIIKKAWKWIE